MQTLLFTILGFMMGLALYASLRPANRPRKQSEEMGAMPTTLLGIAGSAFGYMASTQVVSYQLMGVQPGGLAAAALVACTLVMFGDWVVAMRRTAAQQTLRIVRTPTQRHLKQQA